MMLASSVSSPAMVTFAIYLFVVFLLAWMANRAQQGKSFVGEYFLGSRNIGLWGFALTYAATAASGGSFMGFPSLIYSHGWVLAWWIAGYCVAPLIALGLLAKRINQVSRLAGAITVPELLRKRFGSPAVGTIATVMLVVFTFFFLLAQVNCKSHLLMAVFLPPEKGTLPPIHLQVPSRPRGGAYTTSQRGNYKCLLARMNNKSWRRSHSSDDNRSASR